MTNRLHVSDIRRLYAERFADRIEPELERSIRRAVRRWVRYERDKSARKRLVMDKAMTLEAA